MEREEIWARMAELDAMDEWTEEEDLSRPPSARVGQLVEQNMPFFSQAGPRMMLKTALIA